MIVKSLAWSQLGQYHCLNCDAAPPRELYRKPGAARREAKRQGRSSGTLDDQALILKLRRAAYERWPGGCRERPRCADDNGEALAGSRGCEMSGSEFERENTVADALSAAPASTSDAPAHEHTFRPPAEGLYDLGLEK